MKTVKIYTYLGTNGTITSPVHLEGVYSVVKYNLLPENGHQLTKDGVKLYDFKTVEEKELKDWYEVEKP